MSDEPTQQEEENKIIGIFSRIEEKEKDRELSRIPYVPTDEDYIAFAQVLTYISSLSSTNIATIKIDDDSFEIDVTEISEEETEDFGIFENHVSKRVTVYVDDWDKFAYDIGDDKEAFAEILEIAEDIESSISTLVTATGNQLEEDNHEE